MGAFRPEQIDTQEEEVGEISVGELFDTNNVSEFRAGLNLFLSQNRESQKNLEALAISLKDFEDSVNSVIIDEKDGEKKTHVMRSLDDIQKLYEETVKSRFRKQKPFVEFLYEYLHEAVKVFNNKYSQYITEQERLGQEKEKREAQALKEEQENQIQEIVPVVREELLDDAQSQRMHQQRTPEHEAQISRFRASLYSRGVHNSKEEREMEKRTKEEEILLGAVIESNKLFGEGSKVFHTSDFDDYFTHADLVVSTKDGPLVLIDLTYSQRDAGEKQYYNKEHPLRTLEYPPHPELSGRPGIPVVIGMTQEDARSTINSFLESEARKKIQRREGEKEEGVQQESIEKWVDYILIQLERQRKYVWDYLEGVEDESLLDEYETVIEEYDEAISYFTELKKERSPSVKLDEGRPWDKRILYDAEVEMNDFAQREGKPPSPTPELPELARAA